LYFITFISFLLEELNVPHSTAEPVLKFEVLNSNRKTVIYNPVGLRRTQVLGRISRRYKASKALRLQELIKTCYQVHSCDDRRIPKGYTGRAGFMLSEGMLALFLNKGVSHVW
jgi:hypothetical protein